MFVSHSRLCCVRARTVLALVLCPCCARGHTVFASWSRCCTRAVVLGSCDGHVRVVLALVCDRDRALIPLVLCSCCACTRAVVVLCSRSYCARPVLTLVLSSSRSCRARAVLATGIVVLCSRPCCTRDVLVQPSHCESCTRVVFVLVL